jgi:hypothetical protein
LFMEEPMDNLSYTKVRNRLSMDNFQTFIYKGMALCYK